MVYYRTGKYCIILLKYQIQATKLEITIFAMKTNIGIGNTNSRSVNNIRKYTKKNTIVQKVKYAISDELIFTSLRIKRSQSVDVSA